MPVESFQWIDLDLDLETDRAHRGDDANIQKVSGMITAGKPFVANMLQLEQVGNKTLDPDVKILLSDYDFFYLNFPLNIKPKEDHRVDLISLDIDLESPDGDAICWSMDPMRVEHEKKLTAEATFSNKLSLKLLELGGEAKGGEEYVEYTSQIEAFGLRESKPAWELKALKGRKLSGIQLFHMVVRVSKKSKANVVVTMRAQISKHGLLFVYRVVKKDKSAELFNISL